MGSTTNDNATEGIELQERFKNSYRIKSIDIISCTLQRKCKTVQKLEGATQKSLDEEIKSTDNIPTESTSQKPKTADEDSGQAISGDAQSLTNLTLIKKDSKLHSAEETKEKCSCSAGNSANAIQNEQSVNVQEKDVVDSAVEVAVTPQEPENVTSNDRANGT